MDGKDAVADHLLNASSRGGSSNSWGDGTIIMAVSVSVCVLVAVKSSDGATV